MPTTSYENSNRIVEFEPSDSVAFFRNWIEAVISDPSKYRIEYSEDGGYSYVPLRITLASVQLAEAQIIRAMTNRRKVRAIEFKEANTSSKFIEKSKQSTAKPIPEITSNAYIGFDEWLGAYFFNVPPAQALVINTKTTKLSMKEANYNSIRVVNPERKISHGIARGHCYIVSRPLIGALPDNWKTFLQGTSIYHMANNNLVEVLCARVYDNESHELFKDIPKFNILNNKYLVFENNFKKIGDKFFISEDDIAKFIATVDGTEGQVVVDMNYFQEIYSNSDKVMEDIMDEIVALTHLFEQVVKSKSDSEELSDKLAKTILYRDSVVDKLIELNKIIAQATQKLGDSAKNEAVARLESTPVRG